MQASVGRLRSHRLLGKDGDTVDAGAGLLKVPDLLRSKVLGQDVVGDGDGLFLLKGDTGKAGSLDQVQVFALLNSSGDTTGIHFGGLPDLKRKGTHQDNVGDAEV